MFRYGNIPFFKRFAVDIRKIHVVEFHSAYSFQLFFHPSAHFERDFQDFFNFVFRENTVGIDELQQSRNGVADGDGIALIESLAEFEIFLYGIAARGFP